MPTIKIKYCELKEKSKLEYPLLFVDNSKLLPSSRKSLQHLKIKDGCAIEVHNGTELELIEVTFSTKDSFQIQVKVRPYDEVYIVKNFVADKLNIPINDLNRYSLLFGTRRMCDKLTFAHYGIENGDIVDVYQERTIGSVRGGYHGNLRGCETIPRGRVSMRSSNSSGSRGSFANLAKPAKKFSFTYHGPDWRKVRPGLCLEGLCNNERCVALGKMVIINMGTECIFKLNKNRSRQATNCPICEKHVEPLTCAFNDCQYRYISMTESENGMIRNKSEWNKIEDIYYRFDENESIAYSLLLIEVKSSASSWSKITSCFDCSICLANQNEESNKCIELDECKHKFHLDCISQWATYSKTCPLCRRSL